MVRSFVLLSLLIAQSGRATLGDEFEVVKITPPNDATGVECDPLIQIHTSEKFDPRTADERAVSLIGPDGKRIPVVVTADLGSVVSLSVEKPLKPGASYTIRVRESLRTPAGRKIRPFVSTFRTTATPAGPGRTARKHFQFARSRLDRRDGVCGLALSRSGALFACTWGGRLVRYALDEQGLLRAAPEIVLEREDRRFLSLVCDPSSDAEQTVLWLSHDSLVRKSLGPNDYSGTISRIAIRGETVAVEDFIRGLPTGDHPATGLVFGPNGRLYVSQGALTMLGDKPSLKETPLSAAVLEIDLASETFRAERRPLDVRSDRHEGYDPSEGPVRIFATGVREAYDLCWHSNGQLYAGVNMNDTGEKTPAMRGLSPLSVRPAEMLIRIVEGKYYGHPNPSRGERVLLGGNPTEGLDPWEVEEYPVGTMPDPRFDPTLLLRNLEEDKGPSADGCVEWTGPGPLRGRLLICFYTATRGIHTYAFSADGSQVTDHQPLLDESGDPLRFGAPLDVVFDPAGRLYVADFSAPERGDSGQDGGVWMAAPLVKPATAE